MTIAELNILLAIVTFGLALYIGIVHLRDKGWRDTQAMLGTTVLALVTVTLLTAVGRELRFLGIETEAVAFAAAFFRGIAFVMLLGYALYRHDERAHR